MTQDPNQPEYWVENHATNIMYENTFFTYVDTDYGQIYRTFASKVNVLFNY